MTPLLTKAFIALAAVAGNRIVAAAANHQVQAAAANDDLSIGISDTMGADLGGRLDVIQSGWAELQLGGTVSFGDPLTSDADGCGIEAVPEEGVLVRYACFAMADGEDGDIIPVLVAPGIINTPAA